VKRPPRAAERRAPVLSAVLSGSFLLLAVTGCGLTSPATVTEPYDASDGVGTTIEGTGVSLHNFLVVTSEKGQPGAVIGTIVNRAQEAVTVSLSADPGATSSPVQAEFLVPPRGSTAIGPLRTDKLTLTEMPVGPGEVIGMSAATTGGGTSGPLEVPVLPAINEYASLAPSAAATTAPDATETPEPTETTGASGTAEAEETETS
jgi:hypothetical protein